MPLQTLIDYLYLGDEERLVKIVKSKNYSAVAIYGTGYLGLCLALALEEAGVKILFFIDKNAINNEYFLWPDIKVVAPDRIPEFSNTVIIITSFAGRKKILRNIKRYVHKNKLVII